MSVRRPSPAESRIRTPLGDPQRRCVICRRLASKPELIRVVRRPGGNITIDQRANGRGAYVHHDPGCIAKAASASTPLSRALRCSVPEAVLRSISQSAEIP